MDSPLAPRPRRRRLAPARGAAASALAVGLIGAGGFCWSLWSPPRTSSRRTTQEAGVWLPVSAGAAARQSATRPARTLSQRWATATATLSVGDDVEVLPDDVDFWLPAKVRKVHDDGTCTVEWQEDDRPSPTEIVSMDSVRPIFREQRTQGSPGGRKASGSRFLGEDDIEAEEILLGDDVLAPVHQDLNDLFIGYVEKMNPDGSVRVRFDDPTKVCGEYIDTWVEALEPDPRLRVYENGERAKGLHPDGEWRNCKILRNDDFLNHEVEWDDDVPGYDRITVVPVRVLKKPLIKLKELEADKMYLAKVLSTREGGYFVDIGAVKMCWLRKSYLLPELKETELQVGQRIKVLISAILEDGRVSVTMVRKLKSTGIKSHRHGDQDVTPFIGSDPKQYVRGKVVATDGFAVYVQIYAATGEQAVGYIPFANLKGKVRRDGSAYQNPGDRTVVRVAKVLPDDNEIVLSQKKYRPAEEMMPFARIPATVWLTGTVARTKKDAAIVVVRLADGSAATGFLHISTMADTHVEKVSDVCKIGEEIQVRIRYCKPTEGKLLFTRKKVRAKADVSAFASLPEDTWLDGVVERVQHPVAFVKVTAPNGETGTGELHARALGDYYVYNIEEELKESERIKVRVDEANMELGTLTLTSRSPSPEA